MICIGAVEWIIYTFDSVSAMASELFCCVYLLVLIVPIVKEYHRSRPRKWMCHLEK